MSAACSHLDTIKITSTDKHVCEDCVKTGDTWVHLRLCLECGHVGCCDSSKNKHATKHFHASRHPLIRSIEPGEEWVWCYADETAPGEIRHNHFVAARGERTHPDVWPGCVSRAVLRLGGRAGLQARETEPEFNGLQPWTAPRSRSVSGHDFSRAEEMQQETGFSR